MEQRRFALVNPLETMGEKVAQEILRDFDVSEVRVRVRKPHAPIRGTQDGMEVELTRTKEA